RVRGATRRTVLVSLLALCSILVQGVGTQAAHAANDYPWPTANPNQLSPLRFYYRNCTDFVAWRLNVARGGSTTNIKFSYGSLAFPNGDGNARGWKQGAINSGFTVDSHPTLGAVAWWGTEVGGGFG